MGRTVCDRRRCGQVVIATTLVAFLAGCGHSSPPPSPAAAAPAAPTVPGVVSAPPSTPTPFTPTIPMSPTTPPRVTVPVTAASTTRPAPVAPDAAVMAYQQQLSALGYWLGTPDGFNRGTTSQALIALQKAAGLPRTGAFSPDTAAALAAGTRPTPQSTSGHVIEVDLTHQLVLIVTNGHLDAILNASTGGGYRYYDHGSSQIAVTPTGHFTTTWEVNGTRVSSLGVLWRPKFFVGGIAIHGDTWVPARPVSHGCVRVSNQAINWIWSAGLDPIGTPVWVY